jgi:indolepyruvate ferredoxin oxidoreductase, alpha subunit
VTTHTTPKLLSGNEAVALAALHTGIALGAGYPGTPSTEILERFADLGGHARWSPNEKVALEVAIGAAYGGARALATMKHVGLNVAADPLFTVAYTGVSGALIIISADDPGLASSQNEQDNRHYAVAAGLPMIEPSDSQETYDFFLEAVTLSELWKLPILFRMTTRVCHSKSVVPRLRAPAPPPAPHFQRDIRSRVMIPAYARAAHHRLRTKLAEAAAWNDHRHLTLELDGDPSLGIITSGISFVHAREAAPSARILKLGMTHPLPTRALTTFVHSVKRCIVIEEGDPYLANAVRALGLNVESKPQRFRFGELNVDRIRRIIARNDSDEPSAPPGKPPQLCEGCGHRVVFDALRKQNCIVTGDIGCYTLGVLPPFEAIDTCLCMGASLGIGLGLRHTLPPHQARRVVSVIGDSTFVHSGITGLIEMLYNPPPSGHVLIILDNSTTAMTGHQEHPGTGRTLDHQPTHRLNFENLVRATGIQNLHVVEPHTGDDVFENLLATSLASEQLVVIIARRPCLLVAKRIRDLERCVPLQNAIAP